jgi:hypothetical protein
MSQPETATRIDAGETTGVNLEAYADARMVLLFEPPLEAVDPVGMLWRRHAAAHLAERLDTELRGGVRRWSGDQQAMALLKGAAKDLRTAAAALYSAAERLRNAGDGWHANRTYHAGRLAEGSADALDPA